MAQVFKMQLDQHSLPQLESMLSRIPTAFMLEQQKEKVNSLAIKAILEKDSLNKQFLGELNVAQVDLEEMEKLIKARPEMESQISFCKSIAAQETLKRRMETVNKLKDDFETQYKNYQLDSTRLLEQFRKVLEAKKSLEVFTGTVLIHNQFDELRERGLALPSITAWGSILPIGRDI